MPTPPRHDPHPTPPVRLTRAQVREVDRLAIERYHVPGIVLMENAARSAADVAWQMIGGAPADVEVICGAGNNGGDGLAIARHLHNQRCHVRVWLATEPSHYRGDALANFEIARAMDLVASQGAVDVPRF